MGMLRRNLLPLLLLMPYQWGVATGSPQFQPPPFSEAQPPPIIVDTPGAIGGGPIPPEECKYEWIDGRMGIVCVPPPLPIIEPPPVIVDPPGAMGRGPSTGGGLHLLFY